MTSSAHNNSSAARGMQTWDSEIDETPQLMSLARNSSRVTSKTITRRQTRDSFPERRGRTLWDVDDLPSGLEDTWDAEREGGGDLVCVASERKHVLNLIHELTYDLERPQRIQGRIYMHTFMCEIK